MLCLSVCFFLVFFLFVYFASAVYMSKRESIHTKVTKISEKNLFWEMKNGRRIRIIGIILIYNYGYNKWMFIYFSR